MTQSTLKKTGYAAIGVPVHLASQARERLIDLRQSFDDMRERLSADAQDALDSWIKEGEQLLTSLTDRAAGRREDMEDSLRSGVETARSSVATARDVGRGVAATLTEPIVPVDMINGVGPSYAEKLGDAGVISTRALVERCATKDATERLAAQTGIAATLLEGWVSATDLSRIKGIGEDYMSLLNRAGVATVESLAEEDADGLERRITELNDELGLVASLPSTRTLKDWIGQARKLP